MASSISNDEKNNDTYANILKQLETVVHTLGSIKGNFVTKELGGKIQGALIAAGATIEYFQEKSGLNDGQVRQILSSGNFQSDTAAKALKALREIFHEAKVRRPRNEVAWVSVHTPEAKRLVEKTRKSLEQLLTAVQISNEAGSSDSYMTQAQRLQLVALLKALLAELEGPFVDRGRVRTADRWFEKLLLGVGERVISNKLTLGLDLASSALGGLYSYLVDRPGNEMPEDPSDTSVV